MGSLFIQFDPVTKRLFGSIGGKFLSGIASVVLNHDGARVLDLEGRDLLTAEGVSAGPGTTRSSVERDVADCFGASETDEAARGSTDEIRGFSDWNNARGSL